jgi:hypothetical protein
MSSQNDMSDSSLIPVERIERRILLLRGQKVMLDFQLAELYEVKAKILNQSVRRNIERFPEDFMFQLTEAETSEVLRWQSVTLDEGNWSQIVTSSDATSSKSVKQRSQIVTSSTKHRGLTYRPYAFTEQGVAMLSSVLRSTRAVQVNIAIMRAFVKLRELLSTNADLSRKLNALERKYDAQFKIVFDAIRALMSDTKPGKAREIGFHTKLSGRPDSRRTAAKRTRP